MRRCGGRQSLQLGLKQPLSAVFENKARQTPGLIRPSVDPDPIMPEHWFVYDHVTVNHLETPILRRLYLLQTRPEASLSAAGLDGLLKLNNLIFEFGFQAST